MNNSLVEIDSFEEKANPLQEREAFLVRVIEAIGRVSESADWDILRTELFEPVSQTLERKLMSEVKSDKINEPEIYRLQGQLVWARKYSKLEDLREVLKVELSNIRKI